MVWLLVLIVLVTLIAIAAKKNVNRGGSSNSKFEGKKPLTQIEQVAYLKIKNAVGEDKIVLAQVSFSSFIKTTGDKKEAYAKFNKAKQKVADFVVCNKDFSIHAIIEIDDRTHNKEKDDARDSITKEAGYKTLRYMAKNLPSVELIRKELEL